MFARPRPKKSLLPPPGKKRRTCPKIDEILFDEDQRAEYLTGFRKRRLQRVRHAQEVATEKARQDRIRIRREAREAHLRQGDDHVLTVSRLLREAEAAGRVDTELVLGDEGITPAEGGDALKDDDGSLLATVTVESVVVSRDGLRPLLGLDEEEHAAVHAEQLDEQIGRSDATEGSRGEPMKRHKKRSFRYEDKFERRNVEMKTRLKNAKRKQSRLKRES